MRTKLIIENRDIFVKEIGIFTSQESLGKAKFSTSLAEDEYFATIPLDLVPEVEDNKSALEIAEQEVEWMERNNEF